jgi:hypothetical protein
MVPFYDMFPLLNMNDIRDYQIKTFRYYDFILKQGNLSYIGQCRFYRTMNAYWSKS